MMWRIGAAGEGAARSASRDPHVRPGALDHHQTVEPVWAAQRDPGRLGKDKARLSG